MLSVSCHRASRVSAEAKHLRINAPKCGISRTLEQVVIYRVLGGNEVAGGGGGGGGRGTILLYVMMQYLYAYIHIYIYMYVCI